jgi:hypothetical protein
MTPDTALVCAGAIIIAVVVPLLVWTCAGLGWLVDAAKKPDNTQ